MNVASELPQKSGRTLSVCQLFILSLKWKSVQEKAEFLQHAYGLLLIVVQRNHQIVNLFFKGIHIFTQV